MVNPIRSTLWVFAATLSVAALPISAQVKVIDSAPVTSAQTQLVTQAPVNASADLLTRMELLQQEVDRGAIKPYMSIDSMSYFMVRIGESCTFSEVILDQEPDLDQLEDACKAVRILLGGKPQVEV